MSFNGMTSIPEVVIIGAGLAGLCCVRRLGEHGIACQILEATGDVGGRVRTDRMVFMLLAHVAATWTMAGLIWFVQSVHVRCQKPSALAAMFNTTGTEYVVRAKRKSLFSPSANSPEALSQKAVLRIM